jgi:hypothetical protein
MSLPGAFLDWQVLEQDFAMIYFETDNRWDSTQCTLKVTSLIEAVPS